MLSLLFCVAIQAQTYQTWRSDSGTGDNSWQNAVNWWNFPGESAIVFGQQEWDNNHLPAQVNNADINTWRFLYKAGASDVHTFTGNQISFFDFSGQNPLIINQSTATHIINNNINGDPDVTDPLTFIIDNTGGLTLGGTINNQGWIDISGSTGTATTITFNNVISGTGGITKENVNITLNFKANNTYSGATNINTGTLILEANLENSAVSVGSAGTLRISENATISSLTVAAGGIVIVDAGKSLTITNDLVNNGTSFTLNSGSSLIVNGTSSGNVTYNRNLATTNWYLISSPVSGQAYNDAYVTANGIDSGAGDNRGIATYTTADNTWSYLQSAGSGTFNNGQGYSVKRSSTGDVSFSGTINTSDVSVAVSNAGTGFNLIGNPFTSHLNSASLLGDNSANLVSQTLWVWNQATSSYDTYVTGDSFVLAPTQGFFVKSSNGTNINIAESYQALTGGTFQKSSSSKTEVKLMMNDGSANRFAKLYYLDNVTKGFDNGYDGETFGGIENSVDVFTNLLENNEGKKFQVQSLPIAEMETMIVPVGVKADAGKEITFTAEAMNLPGDVKVFLEDRATNTITRLDEANASYKVTLNDALNGTGRFFLHTKSSGVLSTDEVVLQNTSIYAINNNTLKVVGLPSGNANVKMYNILGKQVMNTSFSSTGVKEISLPRLATGMYIIQLETAAGKLNRKIVLE